MTSKVYVIVLVSVAIFTLFVIATVNYIIDPDNLYRSNKESTFSKNYVQKLLLSTNGLLLPQAGINFREIKSEMADQLRGGYDCAILGSSHVLQVGLNSIKENGNNSTCKSIVNLSVPSTTIEDFLSLLFVLSNNNNAPKTIVLNIDPWSLNLSMNSGWIANKNDFIEMRNILNINHLYDTQDENSIVDYISNLFNYYYFIHSIKKIGSRPYISEAPVFNYEDGYNTAVLLPNGSLLYSNEYINNHRNIYVPVPPSIRMRGRKLDIGKTTMIGRLRVNELGMYYSMDAINVVSILVNYMKKNGFSIVFMMTPHHHNILKNPNSRSALAISQVEPIIRSLGDKLGVKVLGSFNPNTVGCTDDQFYDDTHVKPLCLNRILN